MEKGVIMDYLKLNDIVIKNSKDKKSQQIILKAISEYINTKTKDNELILSLIKFIWEKSNIKKSDIIESIKSW